MDRHPRIQPAVYSVALPDPFDAGANDTPTRRASLRAAARPQKSRLRPDDSLDAGAPRV